MRWRGLPALALLFFALANAQAAEEPLANGVVLVARPELRDPNFRETVLLVTQPVAGGGPLGVILNRKTEVRLSQASPSSAPVPEQFDRLYAGGPLAPNQIIFLVQMDVLPADADTIFNAEPNSLWANLIRKITLRSAQRLPDHDSKNSLTLSIHDFARGLCLPVSLALIASSSLKSSR
jgi:hypothetical protein